MHDTTTKDLLAQYQAALADYRKWPHNGTYETMHTLWLALRDRGVSV